MELIALIIIIVMINSSGKKDKEIARLKNTIRNLEKRLEEQKQTTPTYETPSTAVPVTQPESINSYSNAGQAHATVTTPKRKQIGVSFTGAPIYEDEPKAAQKVIREKPIRKEKELKNSFILGTGAFLIIVAAFSFLYSTWDITSDILKIAVLIVIALVFFGMSHIARNKFKIKQTADTFLYIGLAYIPVVLFAFSILNLVGDFFSASGAGKYIYLAGCAFIVMILYFAFAIKNSDSKLYVAARAMRLAFICLLTANFSENENIIMSILAIYSIIINIYKANTMPVFEKVGITITNYFTLIVSGLCIPFMFLNFGDITSIIFAIVFTLNGFIFYAKNEYNDITYWSIPVGISLLPFITLNLDVIELDYIYTQFMHLIYLVVVFLLFNFKSKNLKNSFNILTLLHILVLALTTFFIDGDVIPASVISILGTLMYFLPVYKEDKYNLMLFAGSSVINYIFLIASFDSAFNEFTNLALVLTSTAFSWYVFRKEEYYKLIPIIGLFGFLSIFSEIFVGTLNVSFVIFIATTLGLTALSINTKTSLVYTISSFVYLITLSAIYYASDFEILIMLLSFVWGLLHLLFTTFEIVPLLAFLVSISSFRNATFAGVNFAFILNIIILALTTLTSLKRKDSIPLLIGNFIFLFTAVSVFDYFTNVYVQTGLFILLSIIQSINKKGILQSFSQLAFSASALTLYQRILIDAGLYSVTALTTLGYLVAGIFAIRYILKKYISSVKGWEYLLCAILYINAFSLYTDPLDLLFFICMLTVVVLVSYKLKYGPIFLCSIIALILNTLYITAGFWFAIPWWIYLVAVGVILLASAMKNEIKEKENKQNIKTIWSKLKETLDL